MKQTNSREFADDSVFIRSISKYFLRIQRVISNFIIHGQITEVFRDKRQISKYVGFRNKSEFRDKPRIIVSLSALNSVMTLRTSMRQMKNPAEINSTKDVKDSESGLSRQLPIRRFFHFAPIGKTGNGNLVQPHH
jgi:hypothetical protein